MYTPQEVFDIVYSHFVLSGNPPAISLWGTCSYIDERGARCAIGIFLPKDTALAWKEIGVGSLEGSNPTECLNDLENAGLPSRTHYRFLCDIQNAHDRSYRHHKTDEKLGTPEEQLANMEVRLKALARRYHLTVPTEPVRWEEPSP